jgi:hypothetical protein
MKTARKYLVVMVALFVGGAVAAGQTQPVVFRVPPVKIPLTIKDEKVTITAWAVISQVTQNKDMSVFRLELSADLSGLQQNLTALLAAQLDKDDKCGERIAVQNATLVPHAPASVATVQVHVERWACVKAFGKQQAKKLVGGNAVVPVRLTPGVENNAELKLTPEVGEIQADGSLGELLRSGTIGDMLREKVRESILNAMQKGTNLSATLPPVAQDYAKIEGAEFRDGGGGKLVAVLTGTIKVTKEQVAMLSKQLKERAASAAR